MTPAPLLVSSSTDPDPSKSVKSPPAEPDKQAQNTPRRLLPAGIEPMLGIDALAIWLNVSRRWLERERSAGRVPKPDFMAGRCPRWKPETIRAWAEKGGRP
jgi:hypothetical protein